MDRRDWLKLSLGALASAPALSWLDAQAASDTVFAAVAGVMGPVMDKGFAPLLMQKDHLHYRGQAGGAYGLAHLITGKQINPDVFVPITPGPVEVVQKAGLGGTAVPLSSTEMVIAYSPKSRFAADFKAAAEGKMPWYAVLEKPGLRFGRTDPRTDPQGQNIIFTLLLAERFYKQPGLMKKILGEIENTQQIFTEASLMARLQSGEIDASSGYLCSAVSHDLPYISLPPQINLSDPAMTKDWYSTVHFQIKLPNGKTQTLSTQPLVFYAMLLKNAPNPKGGQQLIDLMVSPDGRKTFAKFGYGPAKGAPIKA